MKIIRYDDGLKFIKENEQFLNYDVFSKIQTAFFPMNAVRVNKEDLNSFAVRIEEEKSKLIFLNESKMYALIYGSISLAKEMAHYIAKYCPPIQKLLGEKKLVEAFMAEYQKSYQVLQDMAIMYCNHPLNINNYQINQCKALDIPNLIDFMIGFYKDALKEEINEQEATLFLNQNYQDIYFLRLNDQIVSMAMKTRSADESCCISHVYTPKEYRNCGYAKEVVTYVTNQIIYEHKLPYLYVDKTNPISNRLYQHIGFSYLCDCIKIKVN